jgi:hypothetical protein
MPSHKYISIFKSSSFVFFFLNTFIQIKVIWLFNLKYRALFSHV